MKLTVFGPTGGTGEQIVRQALTANHHVTAVARRPAAIAITHPNLSVIEADVLDPAWQGAGIAGTGAVLSALGSRAMRKPTTIYSQGTAAVIAAMARNGVTGSSESPPSPSRPIRKNRRWNATSSIPSFTASSAVATTTCAGWSSCWPTARSPGQCSAPPGSPTGLQPAVTAQPAAAGCRTPGAFPGPTSPAPCSRRSATPPCTAALSPSRNENRGSLGQPTRRRLPAARSSCQRCGVGRPPARR
jgi:hypothetical protein